MTRSIAQSANGMRGLILAGGVGGALGAGTNDLVVNAGYVSSGMDAHFSVSDVFRDMRFGFYGGSLMTAAVGYASAGSQYYRQGVKEGYFVDKTVTFDFNRASDLVDNMWQAQRAGHPDVLTRGPGGTSDINRPIALDEIPSIWSRDEYPFASSLQGGDGSWVGHIPAWQNSHQGGVLSQFYQTSGVSAYDDFFVNLVNHPSGSAFVPGLPSPSSNAIASGISALSSSQIDPVAKFANFGNKNRW